MPEEYLEAGRNMRQFGNSMFCYSNLLCRNYSRINVGGF